MGYLSFYLLSAFLGFQSGSEEKQATIRRLLFPNNNREKYSVRKAITTYLPINVRVAERGVSRYATSIIIWNVVRVEPPKQAYLLLWGDKRHTPPSWAKFLALLQ